VARARPSNTPNKDSPLLILFFRHDDVILAASARIGEEIGKVPKATNAGRGKSQITAKGKLGRTDAMPSGTQRARYQKLAAAKPELKAIAKKLREQGKDGAPSKALPASA
jgi:hypothetical protein